ncbi:MAG: sulfotransferase domain-containing protein [Acidimicrobiales bacterium]
MPSDRLAHGFDEMIEAKNLLFPPITFELGKEFEPDPTDVIITPWSKSGTTWLQQVVHGLRSGGDMDFDDISRISPWIEVAHALGVDLYAVQGWRPRIFKSHYSYAAVPKGCRYIVSFRDPLLVMVSYYRFYEGWLFEPGSVTLDEYLAPHLDPQSPKSYWNHMASWLEQRDNPNVLVLSYEAMLEDLRPAVVTIAEFLGMDAGTELIELVVQQSSREFMLEYEDRFNDLMHRQRGAEVGAHPPGIGSTKVTDGRFDSARYALSPETLAMMDQLWADRIATPFGFETYADVTESLR